MYKNFPKQQQKRVSLFFLQRKLFSSEFVHFNDSLEKFDSNAKQKKDNYKNLVNFYFSEKDSGKPDCLKRGQFLQKKIFF